MFRWALLVLGLVGLTQPTFAQDAKLCLDAQLLTHDDRILRCTNMIAAGGLDATQMAVAHYKRGDAWLAKGEAARAEADYSESLRLNPLNAFVYFDRGTLRRERGDAVAAIADYSQAIRLTPNSPRLYMGRGLAWERLGEHSRAIGNFTDLVRLDMRFGSGYLRRGQNEFHIHNDALAASDFRAALKLDPKDADAAIWLYLAQGRAADANVARNELQRNLNALDARKWPAPVALLLADQIGVAQLREMAGQGEARTQAERTCGVDYYLGHWHRMAGRGDDAQVAFRQAEATCPTYLAEYRAAVVALRAPDAPLAAPARAIAVGAATDRETCMSTGATADDRIAACTRAAWDGHLDLYRARGMAFAAQENWDRAVTDLSEAIRRDPLNASLYADRGDLWHAQDDTYRAMADYNASLHLVLDARVYASRGVEWLTRGIYGSAIGDLTKAIELDPGNAGFFSQRGLAWEKKAIRLARAPTMTSPSVSERATRRCIEIAPATCGEKTIRIAPWKILRRPSAARPKMLPLIGIVPWCGSG